MVDTNLHSGAETRNARRADARGRSVGAATAFYSLAAGAGLIGTFIVKGKDFIGPDNDDIMRLVSVRDLLAGQNWFDLTQYRLGLEGGTLMHWSRLIDLPIGLLIRAFSPFLTPETAEAAAAIIWPLLLVPLLLLPLGLAARRIGGAPAMHIALGLGTLFVLTSIRFAPGGLDHHNVQAVLVAWIAAMLIDPQKRVSSHAIAGAAAAAAIAIGAETVPLVAVACLCVAARWIWHGHDFAGAARAFGLSLALTISAAFLATVPPQSYAMVTCDSLSLGFWSLSALGGAGLFLLAGLPAHVSRMTRIGFAGAMGGALLLTARVIAPQCLGNPLAGLDPMLTELWLNKVTEARSLAETAATEPELIGALFAAGLFALVTCLHRILTDRDREIHLVLLALVGASFGIALIQIRGAFFSNLIAILPLSLLIADLRGRYRFEPGNGKAALAYVAATLAAVPFVWGLAGLLLVKGPSGFSASEKNASAKAGAKAGECKDRADFALLATLPKGVVASPSNSGAEILRFTPHRAISAPYHRNQSGMLAELRIGLAAPGEAQSLIGQAGVTIIAFCAGDPQTRHLMELQPDGLYAALSRGEVPEYLQPVGTASQDRQGQDGFRFYRVVPGG